MKQHRYNILTTAFTALFLLFTGVVNGQVIQTEPNFPTEDQPLTITFDASEADRNDLEGFTGDVYAHTGVIISESDMGSNNWSYVIAEWNENLPELQLSHLGDDLWELEIEDIREFYDVPESVEQIYQLAFVFRSADGSRQTEDLFVDIFDGELTVRFNRPNVSPLNPYFTQLNEIVEFEIVGSAPSGTLASITLFEGESELASVSDSNELNYSYEVTSTGRTDFYVVAEDESGNSTEDSLYIIVNPDVTVQPRQAGIEDGITYHDDDPGRVTFSLFAPDNEFVYLIGDFNDWEVNPDYMMNRDETGPFDGYHYWVEIDGLQPGQEYAFQYFVDGEIRMADLFSEKVLDPWNDIYLINDGIYPDLMPYPSGQTQEIAGVIHPGRDAYDWQVPDFERPHAEELVIYELVIRDFLDEGTYANMADTLGYFERLGVNAIELMPVSQFDGNLSWGYNPAFHFALEKAYGPAEDFKRFVDEAHQRGIAVILDVVYNHATDQSPLIRLKGSDRNENPLIGPGHAYNVFNHLNHDHPYIQYWLDRANRHWLERYNVDGFRFDLTKGFAANPGISSNVDNYNQGRVDNLKRMADEMWSFDSDAYLILEHFQREEELELAVYGRDEGFQGMMFWNNMNHEYSEASMGYTSNLTNTYFGNINGLDVANGISYMESHDEQWMMLKNLKFGNSSSDGSYDVTHDLTALERQKSVAAFFLTVPGPRMLWQFGELGYGGGPNECLKPGDGSDGDCEPSDPGRTDQKPVRWDYYENSARQNVYRSWSEMLRLRNENPVFTSRETVFESSLGGEVKWMRMQHETMDAMIVGNFDVETQSSTVTFPDSGEWFDFVTGTTLNAETADQTFELQPGEVRIYTSQFVEPAGEDVFVSSERQEESTQPQTFRLNPNYPNPFNPTTNISYEIPERSDVTIAVYDMLGREVATLVQDQQHPAGTFTVSFDASGLSSGIYFTRLEAGSTSVTRKMSLIK
ncbi:T9SS C-terminal target domain-containing protein [Rhodohalobacter sp. SW132]|uniref:alpha-amylase family glycosyl hydrolase n=1 Tax=Rhodohalobacter sp. SW132 TaxID=2293433 RepID=UPI000E24B56E|nr:alpha-amylase family glycosyl hydrolase [Rhodohalobacter sp. SW132]REL38237.1 T9SS C-terminal target domain-containing protein [Rhodohalobacter sp. SW132]